MSAKFNLLILVFLFSAFGCQSDTKPVDDQKYTAAGENDIRSARRTTLNGEIVAIEYYDAGNCVNSGIHILLKTATTVVPVHLGPVWYVNQQERLLSIGHAATVSGLNIQFDGKPAVVAIEITTSGGTLKLRDDSGAPYWRGQRRNQRRWGPVCPMYPGS